MCFLHYNISPYLTHSIIAWFVCNINIAAVRFGCHLSKHYEHCYQYNFWWDCYGQFTQVPPPPHWFRKYNLPPLLLWFDVILLYYIYSCYCFRVLHIAFHQVRPVPYGDVVRQELMLFVYTEDSILVLESYVIQELLGSHNNAVIFRYFADMYYTL